MQVKTFKTEYGGTEVIFETGKLAQQSLSSVTVRIGDTMVLGTVNLSSRAREGMDFFPLMVDYEERFYAAGKIKGPRFTKREGRPSTEAVLTGRMIDRGIRPLFPQAMRNEVQVILSPLSVDETVKPDVVAMLAACAALHVSPVPFDGPLAGVRIGMVNGDFIINPSQDEMEYSDLNLTVLGDGERIAMVECDANELPDDVIVQAFELAMETMGPMAKFMDTLRKEFGQDKYKDEELIWRVNYSDEEKSLIDKMKNMALPHLDKYLFNTPKGSKGERKKILKELEEMLVNEIAPSMVKDGVTLDDARAHLKKLQGAFFFDFIEEQVTQAILDRDLRVDGRKLTDIRNLEGEVGLVPRAHGSGFFVRGETHILSIVTLGAPSDTLSVENMEENMEKRYFHHYNFPPYSVGEVKMMRGAGRREIGHGALAEKALKPILPTEEEFPYTVRVVSEVMSSNGSSSMGSTCGSTLALMDAGVPLKKPVAGIAMGLASSPDLKKWKVLTDLQDLEDGAGGMDWKVTSTRDGVTAIQMDTKTHGLSMDIIKAAMPQTREALNQILDVIEKTIPTPREELSPHAPRIIQFMIPEDKIGEVIGPGGKMIREITATTGCQVDVEDPGKVTITSTDSEAAKQAEEWVRNITRTIEVGEIFEEATVVKIMNFGAFVNLVPGTDGLLHISELDYTHVDRVTDRVQVGDTVKVKVIKVDGGKVDVSMKALLPVPEGYEEPRRDRRSGGRDRRGGDRRGGDRRNGGRDRRSNDRRGGRRNDDRRRSRDRPASEGDDLGYSPDGSERRY